MHLSFLWKSVRIESYLSLYPSPDDRKPWGAQVYLHRPKGVMKVVKEQSDSRNRMLWYAFHASTTDFKVLPWTLRALWNGASAGNISLMQNLLSGERSTFLQYILACFLVITIQWHQETGWLTPFETLLITQRASSLSLHKPAFVNTNGTDAGLWQAFGVSDSLIWISILGTHYAEEGMIGACIEGGTFIPINQPTLHPVYILWGSGKREGIWSTRPVFALCKRMAHSPNKDWQP